MSINGVSVPDLLNISRREPYMVPAGNGYEMYAYMIIKEYSFLRFSSKIANPGYNSLI